MNKLLILTSALLLTTGCLDGLINDSVQDASPTPDVDQKDPIQLSVLLSEPGTDFDMPTSDGATISASTVDTNGDGTADGVAFGGATEPHLSFISGTLGKPSAERRIIALDPVGMTITAAISVASPPVEIYLHAQLDTSASDPVKSIINSISLRDGIEPDSQEVHIIKDATYLYGFDPNKNAVGGVDSLYAEFTTPIPYALAP